MTAIAADDLREVMLSTLERRFRGRLVYQDLMDRSQESIFIQNGTVMIPKFSTQKTTNGTSFSAGFNKTTVTDFRYGTMGHGNRPQLDHEQWRLDQKTGYEVNVSRRDEIQTSVALASNTLDVGSNDISKEINDFGRTTFAGLTVASSRRVDTARMTTGTTALSAGTDVPLEAQNGKKIINALAEIQSLLMAAGIWPSGETPVQPYCILPPRIYTLIQLSLIEEGSYNIEPISTTVMRSGQVPGFFGWTFIMDADATVADTGTTRATLHIGLTGQDASHYSAIVPAGSVRIPAGQTRENPFHDVYGFYWEYGLQAKPFAAERVYNLRVRAAA